MMVLVAALAIITQPAVLMLRNVGVGAMGLTPDASQIKFQGSPKYVRENNITDVSAQLITYRTTTEVNFYIDGDTEAPIAGIHYGVSGARYDKWQLKTPLAAGEHSITAQVKIGGQWYWASNTGTAYSLDTPTASYISPTTQKHMFQPSDNPLRLKVDDEFKQFKDAEFHLYRYDTASSKFGESLGKFTITRNQCSQNMVGQYLLCDIDKTTNWRMPADGTYAVKLKTRTQANNGVRASDKQYWSPAFTIDSAAPVVTNFNLESDTTVGGDLLKVAATATDNNAVQSVRFYVATLQSDGMCVKTGGEISVLSPDAADSKYRAVLDISGLKSNTYCVMAVARDDAMNNSAIVSLTFIVDHTGPVVTMQSTGSTSPMASTHPISLAGNVTGEFKSLTLTQNGVAVAVAVDPESGAWSYTLPKGKVVAGEYNFAAIAEDMYGNKSTEATLMVSVNPFVPGRDAAAPRSLASRQAPSLAAPRTFAVGTTTPFTAVQAPEKKSDDTGILGAETTKNPSQSSDLPVVAATENGWKIFGIAWFWWAVILAILAMGAWWTVASIRRRKAAELA